MIDIFNMPPQDPAIIEADRLAYEDCMARRAAGEQISEGIELSPEDDELLGNIHDLVGILAPHGHEDPEAVQDVIAEILAEDAKIQAAGAAATDGAPPAEG